MSIFASEDKAEIKDNHSRGKNSTLPSVYLIPMYCLYEVAFKT